MLSAISAEALKLTRHKASWFLVWIYPIAFLIIFALLIGDAAIDPDPPQAQAPDEWIDGTVVAWHVPNQAMGRYLIAAFVALAFAGEYGWNTWKLIVPHRARASLIAAKYVVIFALFAVSLFLAAVVTLIGGWTTDTVAGHPIPDGVNAGTILAAHAQAALVALAPGLVTIGYASLAAVLTRSTIAGLVIAIVAVTVEGLVFRFGPMLSARAPDLMWGLYQALPGYHLANLQDWIVEGRALRAELMGAGAVELGWATSLAVTVAWIAGLFGLTFGAFRRQDLN
ncbi:MAG: ABC transporter permease [Allosphingosinicella sp.]